MAIIGVLLLLWGYMPIKNSYNTYLSYFQSPMRENFSNRGNKIEVLKSNSGFLFWNYNWYGLA